MALPLRHGEATVPADGPRRVVLVLNGRVVSVSRDARSSSHASVSDWTTSALVFGVRGRGARRRPSRVPLDAGGTNAVLLASEKEGGRRRLGSDYRGSGVVRSPNGPWTESTNAPYRPERPVRYA